MRTTLTLEHDASATAQADERARSLELGEAVSALVLQGSAQSLSLERSGGVWVFDLPPEKPLATSKLVCKLLDEAG